MFNKNTYNILSHGHSPTSSLSHPSTSLLGLNGGTEISFHHHHHDMFSGHYFAAAAAAPDSAALFNQDVGGLNGDLSSMVNSFPRAAKKDRHSKIYTAQGPRDRRVRLSIGVARRFFDLQETLGFDKPSKTLDWLLTKSKSAIKELLQMRREKGHSISSLSNQECCEVDSAEASEDGNKCIDTDSTRKLVKNRGGGKDLSMAKESRMKARARARERTREKNKLNETTKNDHVYNLNNNSSIPIQFMNNQLEFCKISGSSSSNIDPCEIRDVLVHQHPVYEAANEDLIQESIVIKRKVKHPSILGFQQNFIISSSNYGVPSPYINAADNWDFSSFTSQSNISAILDQHKFINSNSNN